MQKTATLTQQDLEDLLNGAALLGAGGGGPRSVGEQIIEQLVTKGTMPVLIQPAELEDGALGAVSAFVGAPDAVTGQFDFTPAVKAFAQLSQKTAQPLRFVLPGEVGAGNTFIPMAVAVSMPTPLPVVDCAGARRAIPALGEDTYAAAGVPISPIVIAGGDKVVTIDVPDPITADSILRGVISGIGNTAGVAMWTMDGKTVRTAAVEGTTTYAMELGRAIRCAAPGEKVAAACNYLGGWLVARGKITAHAEETSGGFDLGTTALTTDEGWTLTVYNQNENLIGWSSRSPRPIGMAPDLLCFMTDEGVAFSNADAQASIGNIVNVIAQPSIAAMRAPYVVAQFLAQLESIGYAGPYVPIEQLR